VLHHAAQMLGAAPVYAHIARGLFLNGPGPVMGRMVDKVVWKGDLQGCFESDPQRAQQLFAAWNEEVKRVSATVYVEHWCHCAQSGVHVTSLDNSCHPACMPPVKVTVHTVPVEAAVLWRPS
jgi:hypothetical protein